nr:SprT family zinc-dependent metalloprotease [Roseicitreum antarcticum]
MPLPGTPDIRVQLRRSRQARRLSLRVSQLDGRVTLSMPLSLPLAQAQRFLADRADWVRNALGGVAGQVVIRPGAQVMWQGAALQIAEAPLRAPRIDGTMLLVPPDPGHSRTARRVAAFLRMAALEHLTQASDHYAGTLGRGYRQICLRDTRSRWGSCTVDGRLMYSWRLVMAPPAVLAYVAAHEVAHLAEMNHSPRFWAHVGRLMPEYAQHRGWLRQHGRELHRYVFDAPQEGDIGMPRDGVAQDART